MAAREPVDWTKALARLLSAPSLLAPGPGGPGARPPLRLDVDDRTPGRARFAEIVSPPRPGGTVLDRPDQLPRRRRALADYPSQFEVVGEWLRHVGEQQQPIETACRLRWCDC